MRLRISDFGESMRQKSTGMLNKLYTVSLIMILLQVAAIAFTIRYGNDILFRDKLILDHTSSLVNEAVPSMQSDLTEVARGTSEIRLDVQGIRNKVTAVGERVSEISHDIQGVSKGIDELSTNTNSFFTNKSGLIWGHSLNPYILITLLVCLMVSVPTCAWFIYRQRIKDESPLEERSHAEIFTRRLDTLSELMERIRTEELNIENGVELRKIMEETERLINDARSELGLLTDKIKLPHDDDSPRLLH
jgi:hypothetical protein